MRVESYKRNEYTAETENNNEIHKLETTQRVQPHH